MADGDLAATGVDREFLEHGLPVGLLEVGQEGRIVWCNEAFRHLTGRNPVAERLRSYDLIHPADHREVSDVFFASFDRRDDWTVEFRVLQPTGEVRWVRAIGRTRFAEGDAVGVLATWFDVTDEVRARGESDRFMRMFEAIPDPVMIVDEELRILYANPAGWASLPPDALETGLYSTLTDASWRALVEVAIPAARRDGHWVGELASFGPAGQVNPFLVSMALERDPLTDLECIASISRDISELRTAQEDLRRQAAQDALTGLANRREFFARITEATTRAARPGSDLAVLYIDLDRFKEINDERGHEVGDEVLVEAAARISSVVRAGDLVARLGGDEFVVLCEQVGDRAEAGSIAHRIVTVMRQPFVVASVGEPGLHLGASVGVAHHRANWSASELLRAADGALYAAKKGGRNQAVELER